MSGYERCEYCGTDDVLGYTHDGRVLLCAACRARYEEETMSYADTLDEQRAYYALCDEARALGIPTSLDDPRSPKTLAELAAAVARAKEEA